MTRSVWAVLIVFGLALPAACTTATSDGGPDYYAVSGVAADSVLNIRAEPSAKSEKIGEIPHNARALRNLGCTGVPSFAEWSKMSGTERRGAGKDRWCRVRYQGLVGWVAGRYLREDSNPPATLEHPARPAAGPEP